MLGKHCAKRVLKPHWLVHSGYLLFPWRFFSLPFSALLMFIHNLMCIHQVPSETEYPTQYDYASCTSGSRNTRHSGSESQTSGRNFCGQLSVHGMVVTLFISKQLWLLKETCTMLEPVTFYGRLIESQNSLSLFQDIYTIINFKGRRTPEFPFFKEAL